MTVDDTTEQLKCSFCGKSKPEVAKLVAGPGVNICDVCIRLGYDIVTEEQGADETRTAAPPFATFTQGARAAVVEGQQAARELHHNFYGTEHLLLGVLNSADGKLAELFASHGATVDTTRAKVTETVGPSKPPMVAAPPFTPRAMRALQLAGDQATELGSDRVDIEHLVLGLLSEGHGLASQLLSSVGITPDEVRTLLTSE